MENFNDGWLLDDKPTQYNFAEIEIRAIQSAMLLAMYNKEALEYYIAKVTEKTNLLFPDKDMGGGATRLR